MKTINLTPKPAYEAPQARLTLLQPAEVFCWSPGGSTEELVIEDELNPFRTIFGGGFFTHYDGTEL